MGDGGAGARGAPLRRPRFTHTQTLALRPRRKFMRHTKTVVAWLSVVLAACAAAPAAITTTFVQIPISPAAIASDPALAGYQSWDVRVNVSGASEWGFSGMTAQRTRGLFYNPALGADFPVPTLWGAFPHVRYDTFVP